ncbi:hypothetical protein GCM10009128_10540 [Psychrosphaera haliotis]|uniref:hypothetical protein n=1 Tax=Psychrosphaera haliotis TaxID=555083 RepID=UPI0031E20E4A
MKNLIMLTLATATILVVSFNSGAVRHQENKLVNTYYTDASKNLVASVEYLPCPTYGNNSAGWRWLEPGPRTEFVVTSIGEKCEVGGPNGPGMEPE